MEKSPLNDIDTPSPPNNIGEERDMFGFSIITTILVIVVLIGAVIIWGNWFIKTTHSEDNLRQAEKTLKGQTQ